MLIFSTIEFDAWSRDFNYKEYLDLYYKRNVGGCKPICHRAYEQLCIVFDTQYEYETEDDA